MAASRIEFLKALLRGRFHRKYKQAVRSLSPHFRNGGVIFDVGGNQGRFAREFALFEGGACPVHVFEPLEDNVKLCRINLGSCGNAVIHPFALSDWNGWSHLIIPLTTGGHDDSCTPYIGDPKAVRGGGPKGGGVRQVPIECRRLDDVMKSQSLPPPSFIKIDVEGHATKVIDGSRETIERHRPGLLVELSEAMETRGGVMYAGLSTTSRTWVTTLPCST